MMNDQIVITGLGCINALAENAEDTWKEMLNGKSGIETVAQFADLNLQYQKAAKIKSFNCQRLVKDRKLLKLISLDDAIGIYAANQAVENSDINQYRDLLGGEELKYYNNRTGLFVGSDGGGVSKEHEILPLIAEAQSWEEYGDKLHSTIQPMWILRSLLNNVLAHVGIKHQFTGVNQNIVNYAVSGFQALQEACHAIHDNKIDRALVVAFSSMVEVDMQQRWRAQGLLGNSDLGCFNAEADGTVFGEGGAAFFLERSSSATTRGVSSYAQILGLGFGSDSQGLFAVDPNSRGLFGAVHRCLEQAQISPKDVGLIIAHADGILTYDETEALVYRELFPEVPITSYKWALGNTRAAGGLLDTMMYIYSLKNKCVPAVSRKDLLCANAQELNIIDTQHVLIAAKPVLITSRGFDGLNMCLIIQ